MQQNQTWHTLPYGLPAGERVYAVGDIHGCDQLLAQLLRRISLDRQLRAIRRATLVFVGDYVDRGRGSRQVIDMVLQQPPWADQVVRILGNHEAFFLSALRQGPLTGTFLRNGGIETLVSYGVAPGPLPLKDMAHTPLMQSALAKIPPEHMELLTSGVDRFALGDFFFCHAGVRPGVPLGSQTTADLQSIRHEFLGSSADFGAFVVHGHTKVDAPEVHRNRVNLDTGAHKSGRLTCGVFEDNRVRFITTNPVTAPAAPGGGVGLRKRPLFAG